MTTDASTWPVIEPGDIQVGDTIQVEEITEAPGRVITTVSTGSAIIRGSWSLELDTHVVIDLGTIRFRTLTVRREPKPVPERPDGTIALIGDQTREVFGRWDAQRNIWVTRWDGFRNPVAFTNNPDGVEVVRVLPDNMIAIPKLDWSADQCQIMARNLADDNWIESAALWRSVADALDAEAKP